MSRQIPLEEIPDSSTVPEGVYNVKIMPIEVAMTQNAGKLMYKVTFRIEDGDYADQAIFDNFVIGSDEDPDATNAATWKKFGGQRWKKFVKAAQVPFLNDETDLLMALTGQRIAIRVTSEEQQEGKYKGELRNNVKAYLPYGSPA